MWKPATEMTNEELADNLRGIKNLNFMVYQDEFGILEEAAKRLKSSGKE